MLLGAGYLYLYLYLLHCVSLLSLVIFPFPPKLVCARATLYFRGFFLVLGFVFFPKDAKKENSHRDRDTGYVCMYYYSCMNF
jgi:hypothetical protein